MWLVGAITGTIRWLEVLAISLYTLRTTESALAVSVLLFARILPPPLLGVFIGALADRIDRKRLYLAGLAIQVLVSAALAALAASGRIGLWQIALGAILSGVFWSLEHPVRRPMLGEAAGTERIGRALSLDSATFNATRMAGPLVGGVAFESVGLPGAYAVSLALYAVAIALVVPASFGPPATTHRAQGSMLREGLELVRRDRGIAAVLAVTAIANLFGFAYAALVPVIGERVLALNAIAVGSLMAMEGLGALVGALVLAATVQRRHFLRVFTGGAALFLAMVLAFSLSASYAVSLVALLAAGLGIAAFGAMQSSILLVSTPPEARSRIMGMLVVCIGTQPLGVLHAGLLAESLGAASAMTVIALEGLASLAIAAWLWPELRGHVTERQ
jgi:MFS family permease